MPACARYPPACRRERSAWNIAARHDWAERLLRPGMHSRDARQNVARRPDCARDGFSSFRDAESGCGAEVRRTRGCSPPLAGFFGKDMKSKRWDGVVHESAWFRIRELLMGYVAGEEARLRQVLARAAQWGVTSITLLEGYPPPRVRQLSEIDSPLLIHLVPFLQFHD